MLKSNTKLQYKSQYVLNVKCLHTYIVTYIEMLFHALPSEVLAVWEPWGREKPSRNEQDVIPDTILERIGGRLFLEEGPTIAMKARYWAIEVKKRDKKIKLISGMEGTERGLRGGSVHDITEILRSQPLRRAGDQKQNRLPKVNIKYISFIIILP